MRRSIANSILPGKIRGPIIIRLSPVTGTPKADEVSMEEGLAKRLNVALGDTVTFMGDTRGVPR